jgi:hypothetical protein
VTECLHPLPSALEPGSGPARGSPLDTRGWLIEWVLPVLDNPTAQMAIGQWYFNLETGIIRIGGQWAVYFFGDDNGFAGVDPDWNANPPTWRESGNICSGRLAHLPPGRHVTFRYEWCSADPVHQPNQQEACVWVDVGEGSGWHFLAADARGEDVGRSMAPALCNFRALPAPPLRRRLAARSAGAVGLAGRPWTSANVRRPMETASGRTHWPASFCREKPLSGSSGRGGRPYASGREAPQHVACPGRSCIVLTSRYRSRRRARERRAWAPRAWRDRWCPWRRRAP